MSDELGLVAALLHAAGIEADPAAAEMVAHGLSGDLVFRLPGAPGLYGKIAANRRISRNELTREIAALQWLEGRAEAARLVWSGEVEARPAMLTEAIEGVALHALAPEQAEAGAVAALAALTRLHAFPIGDCPFDERLAVKLAEAELRLGTGEFDAGDLDVQRQGRSADDLRQELIARRPASEDLVVTHGDACWPNFILRPDGVAAMIDLGRMGLADRHQDLALFIRSARYNYPDLPIQELVAAHYRLAAADPEKLELYQLLGEFF